MGNVRRSFHGGWVLVTVLLLMMMSAGVSHAQTPEITPEPREPLRLAMSGAFQPFSTTDEDGNLVGFDADIASEIGKRLGVDPVLVQADWAGIQAGLHSGKYELICGSVAITDERLQSMHFSLPYYISGAQIFALGDIEDIAGKRIGVTEASTYANYIAEHPEDFPDVEVTYYGSEAEIVAAMNTGKIDAFVSDRIVGGFYIKKGSVVNIVPLGGLLYREACGIAARPDSAALVHRVNRALFEMVQDGTYAAIYEKWVGAPPDLEVLLASWGDYAQHIPPLEGQPVTGVGASERPGFVNSTAGMLPLLVRGAIVTLQLSLITAIVALITGALVGMGTVARRPFLRRLSGGFIWVVRGVPLLVQLFIAYFAIATFVNNIVGLEIIGAFGAALIALVVNTTAYNAETLRGGINSVEAGQWDAAASLGMPRSKTLRRVVLPQAIRYSLPSLGNNFVVLIKDTSLVGAITLIELTYAARNVVFQTGQAFLPFLLAAAFYLAMISLVTLGVNASERYMHRSRQRVGSTI